MGLPVKGITHINLVVPIQNLKIRKGGGTFLVSFAFLYIALWHPCS